MVPTFSIVSIDDKCQARIREPFLEPHFGWFPITFCADSANISAMFLDIFLGLSSSDERVSKQFFSSSWYYWLISWFSIALFQSYFTLSDGFCLNFLKQFILCSWTAITSVGRAAAFCVSWSSLPVCCRVWTLYVARDSCFSLMLSFLLRSLGCRFLSVWSFVLS